MKRPIRKDFESNKLGESVMNDTTWRLFVDALNKHIDHLESQETKEVEEVLLSKVETELQKVIKIHGGIAQEYNHVKGVQTFKLKDGSVYRVGLERQFGKATLDGQLNPSEPMSAEEFFKEWVQTFGMNHDDIKACKWNGEMMVQFAEEYAKLKG